MTPHVFDGVLGAAKEGAEWAWTEIYSWLAPQIGGYFRVRGLSDPDDMIGEVFVQIAWNLPSFKGDIDGFRSWVFMIAHNRLVNERRRVSRRPMTLVPDVGPIDVRSSPSAEHLALNQLDDERVLRLMEGLSAEQQSVLALRVVAGFSLAETARIMDRSVGSIKQAQRRALIALRRLISEEV